jgi:arylsulfatase A-like enzyme
MLGDHHMGSKLTFFEGSAHIPLIIRPPAAPWPVPDEWGTCCDRLACLADLMPTCLRIAGLDAPEDVDGVDLMGELRSPSRSGRVLVGDCQHQFFAVIDGPWKYHWSASGGVEMLFDVETDPQETVALQDEQQHKPRLITMRDALVQHLCAKGSRLAKGGGLQPLPGIASSRAVSRYPGLPGRP